MSVIVIMPTYNQAEFIEEALVSVVGKEEISAISAIIIVNDGSTDNTQEIQRWRSPFHGPEIIYLSHEENKGTAAAINTGFDDIHPDDLAFDHTWVFEDNTPGMPEGYWVSWVSSDNVYEPRWADKLCEILGDRSDIGVIYSAYWHGSKDRVLYTPYDPKRLISNPNCYFGPCFLIRGDVWKEAGEHRGKISHDYDHWLRVEEVCWKKGLRIIAHPEPLCFYRVHPKRVTTTRKHEYDAPHWQQVARERRGLAGLS